MEDLTKTIVNKELSTLNKQNIPENTTEHGKIFFSIVYLRKKNNITQAKLAEELGISQTLLNRIEYCKQNPTPELLQKIADYFDEDVESLTVDHPTYQQAYQILASQVHILSEKDIDSLSNDDRRFVLSMYSMLKSKEHTKTKQNPQSEEHNQSAYERAMHLREFHNEK